MTLRLIEGFDDGLMSQKSWVPTYVTTMPSIVTGRFGGGAAQMNYVGGTTGSLGYTITGTVVVGVAIRPDVFTPGVFLMIGDAWLCKMAGGYLALLRGGTKAQVAISSSPIWSGAVWRYIELKYVLSTGACEVRVDGVTIMTGAVATSASVMTLQFPDPYHAYQSSSNGIFSCDDLYVLDTTGTTNNDFLGDVRVNTLLPSADGTHHDMTPSSGTTHYSLVDDATPDTTSYVTTSSAGAKETYRFQPLSSTVGGVYGIRATNYAHKDGAGTAGLRNIITSGGTDYESALNASMSASWAVASDLWEQNPATGGAWTQTSVNDSEFGVEST